MYKHFHTHTNLKIQDSELPEVKAKMSKKVSFQQSKMESLNIQVFVVLLHLEVKQHTVPHLKALTSSLEHSNGHGNTFEQQHTVLNSTHFT